MTRSVDPLGKAALFSKKKASKGPFVLECAGCRSQSRLDFFNLARLAFPVNFTNPLRYHHTWMKCPACGRRNWTRIRPYW